MLIHQTLKRFHSANCVITCEDAARMPDLKGPDDLPLKLDRILCDVICSGDGTLRKNPKIWKKWTPQDGLGLHRMQLAIARRGAAKLKVGGRMVYSTCSMNPIEDQAVVAHLIRESKGSLRLVDSHPLLPKLKTLSGVSTWKVFNRDMIEYSKPEEVEEKLQKMICSSCFPPSEEEAIKMNLHYTMRIVPHHQDTGGFYVALLEKVAESDFEPDAFSKHYGVEDAFYYQNLFSRKMDGDTASRQLFFVNDAAKDFVIRTMKDISIQNAGMKMFSRTENKVEEAACKTRSSNSNPSLKVEIPLDDMFKLRKTDEALVRMETLTCAESIRSQQNGSVVLYVDKEEPVCTWVGYHTVAPYVSKEERLHILRMMGVDCSEIEDMMKTKRKQKAVEDRVAARPAADDQKEDASYSNAIPDLSASSSASDIIEKTEPLLDLYRPLKSWL